MKRDPNRKRSNCPEYSVWKGMKSRCLNPKARQYADYGGRGITVCERWLASFQNFFADMGPRPSSKRSIERVNNDGNYESDNCIWALRRQQSCNKRNTEFVEYNGRRLSLVELARAHNIDSGVLHTRLQNGWPIEHALAMPTNSNKRKARLFFATGVMPVHNPRVKWD
jgi:hypothetical protein